MKIAVLGATGTAGRAVAEAATSVGHEVRPLSRATGVDLHTGVGLVAGLAQVDAVIDASNAFPTDATTDVIEAFRDATSRIVQACQRLNIGHLVHLSICNIDQPVFADFDYYLAKRAQEEALTESSLSHTIVRSTQWMEFALNPAAVQVADDQVRVEDWLIQPIAVSTVANVLVDALTGDRADRQITGPEQIHLPDLTRRFLAAIGDARSVVASPASMPDLSTGALLAPEGATVHGPTIDQWVANQSSSVE